MNKDKINEIGAKLNVDTSDVKQRNIQRFIIRPLYFLTQIVIVGISALITRSLVTVKKQATYPIDFYFTSVPAALFILTLHGVNGLITLPGQKKFGLSKNIRISVFLLTLLASLFAIQHYLGTLTAISYPQGVEYGVYSKNSRNKSINHV
ncbi:MAG: hypothetical protein ACFE95_00120 [Candidatus Hodarchaeota archaeon]